MKQIKMLVLFLILCIALSPLSAYAKTLTLNKILSRLAKPRATSLQKLETVEEYKGEIVRGTGTVKDVLKSFGTEGEAMVYLKKYFRGKEYEIVLMVPQGEAEKVRKGMSVKFEAVFVGMTFKTLRFEEAELIKRVFWFF
ncbi:MAG: hypothetical protein WBC74_00010 [Candidatus Omnitrophota bacterium]